MLVSSSWETMDSALAIVGVCSFCAVVQTY